MANNNQFQILKEATQKHLPVKKYVFRPRKPKMRGKKVVKDKEGNTLFTNQFYEPTPSKMILLSLAFNMALENYDKMRKDKKGAIISNLFDFSGSLIRFFKNKYYNNIEDISKNSQLIDESQNYKYVTLENFRQIEYKLYKVVKRFRNYHSHYIHEPGIISFRDLFNGESSLNQSELNEAKAWFQKRFDDAHFHLSGSLKTRREKLKQQEQEANDKDNKKILAKKIKQIGYILKDFEKISFESEGQITIEGQLFIACNFLTKRQAKVILERWRGLKNVEGYANSLHTFFTYFSLRERYSLNNYQDNLLQFRTIVSRLSTVPYNENEKLAFIYDKIKELNADHYTKLDAIPDGLNQQIERWSKKEKTHIKPEEQKKLTKAKKQQAEKEALLRKIIPVRKKNIFTEVLLQYILDNGLLENENENENEQNHISFKIAVKKTLTDRLKYYEEHKTEITPNENLTALKERIKAETDHKKRARLNEHLKELKRNFIFKSPAELSELIKTKGKNSDQNSEENETPPGYRFSIKKKNALLQFDYNNQSINVVLSPDLLLKWVFLHLEKEINIVNKIEDFITERYDNLNSTDTKQIIAYYEQEYPQIPLKKLLPKSFLQIGKNKTGKTIKERAIVYLHTIMNNLEQFRSLNNRQAKPWKFAAKRKIDTILRYMQARLLNDVYVNQMDRDEPAEDFIRHTSLNMTTYNTAREYFRFFGRYQRNTIHQLKDYVQPALITKMKDEHATLFDYLREEIAQSDSLEELFNASIKSYLQLLSQQAKRIPELKDAILTKLFKIQPPPEEENINELIKKMFIKTIEIGGEIISVKEEMKSEWQHFLEAKSPKNTHSTKSHNQYSEFSFIRDYLTKKDSPNTNIDFIFQHILPLLPKEPGKDRKIGKVFELLLKQKTEELVLWNIAKTYWKKASDKPYLLNEESVTGGEGDFQDFCFFNKVYRQDLEYEYKIDEAFWTKEKGKNKRKFPLLYKCLSNGNIKLCFTIKVPASKYDNKFIMYESELIMEYMCCYHLDKEKQEMKQPTEYRHPDKKIKRTFDLNRYEDILNLVYRELKKSVQFIGEILRAEKKIVDEKRGFFLGLLDKKYSEKQSIKNFYIALTDNQKKAPQDYHVFDAFLRADSETEKNILKDYLIRFRNFALHYQLQNPEKVDKILQFLSKINQKIDKNEYVTEE